MIHQDLEELSSRSTRRTSDKVERRRAVLLDELSRGQWIAVEDLIAQTGASQATVRRDLRHLEGKGMVRRDHGAVRLAESPMFEPFLDDPGFRDQVRKMAAEKRRIGTAAAALIANGDNISIAPGTTTSQIGQAIRGRKKLTIVTNAVNIAMELSRSPEFRVHLTGGYLSGDWFAMVGSRAIELSQSMFPDKFFFGANGIHPERGVTDRHTDEASVNHTMAKNARKRILVADHTKFGQIAMFLVCPIREVDTIITDIGATDEVVAPFRALGIEVIRV